MQAILGRRDDSGLMAPPEGNRCRRTTGRGTSCTADLGSSCSTDLGLCDPTRPGSGQRAVGPGGIGHAGGGASECGSDSRGQNRPTRGSAHAAATTPATLATSSEKASKATVRALMFAGVSAV